MPKFSLPKLPYRDDIFFGLIILLVLVLPLAFFMGSYEKFDTVKAALWYVLAGSAALALLFSKPPAGREHKTVLVHNLLFWLLPALALLGLVSALAGGDYINSFFGFFPRLNQSVILFILWSGTVFLLLAGLTRDRLEFLLKVLLFGGLLAALAAIVQCLGWGIYLGPQITVLQRAPGLLGNPDFSALFLAALVPLGLWLWLEAKKLAAQIYYACIILVLMVAVLMLGSRGAWLGLGVELLLLVLATAIFRLGRKLAVSAVVILLVFGGLWYGLARPSQTNFAGRSLSLSETNVDLRFAVWDIADQAILQHPWLGVGPGNFQLYFERHRDKALGNQDGVYDDAHNWFLQIGSTVGLPFLLLNLILIVSALVVGFKRLQKQRDVLALSLITALVGFCVMASFTPLSVGCYFLLALLLAALFYFDARETNLTIFRPARVALAIVAAVAVVWGVVFFSSEIIFYRAYTLYFAGQYQKSLSLVNFAIRLNPTNYIYFIYRAGDEMRVKASQPQLNAAINRFMAMQPADANSYAVAANIYFLRYLDVSNNLDDLGRAISLLKQSLAIDPNRASRNIQLAVYLFTQNQPDAALNYDVFGLSLDKTSVPGWLLQARLLQMKGDRAGTLWALQQAMAEAPTSQLLKEWYKQIQAAPDFSKLLIPVGYQESTLE
jgi:O-antigen ligase